MKKTIAFVLMCLITLFAVPVYADTTQDTPPERHRWVGMQFDLGVPDGVALGISAHPLVDWLRVNVSGTYNVLAPGIRAGLTFDPLNFPVAPTLTTEGGIAFSGTVPGTTNLPSISYDYINWHLGLEFGKRNIWRIFLRGGMSYLHINTENFQAILPVEKGLTVSDPSANAFAPSGKLGFSYFF